MLSFEKRQTLSFWLRENVDWYFMQLLSFFLCYHLLLSFVGVGGICYHLWWGRRYHFNKRECWLMFSFSCYHLFPVIICRGRGGGGYVIICDKADIIILNNRDSCLMFSFSWYHFSHVVFLCYHLWGGGVCYHLWRSRSYHFDDRECWCYHTLSF